MRFYFSSFKLYEIPVNISTHILIVRALECTRSVSNVVFFASNSIFSFICRHLSISEVFFGPAYFSHGNFGFKLSRVRNLGKNYRGIFVVRTLRFFKVRCHACSCVTLIPSYGKCEVPSSVYCEGCGKVVLAKGSS